MKFLRPCASAFALLLTAVAAFASPITYSFSGEVSAAGTPVAVTGSFSLDTVNQTIGAFSFTSNGSVIDNSTPGADAVAELDDAGGQVVSIAVTLPTSAVGILLDFATLPGPLNLNPFTVSGISQTSGLYTADSSGNGAEYAFTSGSASAVPEPPTLALFAGGVLLLGLAWRRRSRALLSRD